VIQPYKSAFLDLTIAMERLTAARVQLANAWARAHDNQESGPSNEASLCNDADDLQNRLNDLTDKVRRAWTELDDR
jgi:hypothetical protein